MQQRELALVVAALHSSCVHEDWHVVEVLRYLLGTYKHRNRVVEELHVVLYLLALRRLVGYERHHARPVLGCHVRYEPCRMAHLHTGVAHALAHLLYYLVKLLVYQLVVYLGAHHVVVYPQAHGCHPLPVAVVTHEERQRLAFIQQLVCLVYVHELHTLAYFGGRD